MNETEVWIPGARSDAVRRVIDLGPEDITAVLVGEQAAGVDVRRVDGAAELHVDRSNLHNNVAIELTFAIGDATALWTPGRPGTAGRFPPSWRDAENVSALNGIALCALVDGQNNALVTVAAEAGPGALAFRCGAVEETGRLFVAVEAGPGTGPLVVRCGAPGPFSTAVARAVDWLWGDGAELSAGSVRPVFCTWYSMHLDVTQDEVLRQAEAAARLGFGTVIIDDGWQTAERVRGYATAGDWEPSAAKFPAPRALMRSLHELGLRGMWWVGTPFAGDRSRLAAQGVPVLRRLEELETSVVDVRSPSSRAHLEQRVLTLVRDTGADGVKIDFLEHFADPADVEEAALSLLRSVRRGLADVVTDPLIEYRQPYTGPAIAGLATMVRVGDCPLGDLDNRLGVIDLRLTTRGIAVHGDPIMWAPGASAGRVAQSLINSLFGVPQVSVDLVGLPPHQRDALRHWLRFWSSHADVLLGGTLTPHRPDLGYPVVEASAGGTTIVARYSPHPVAVAVAGLRELLVANADHSEVVVHGLHDLGVVDVSIVGPTGERYATWTARRLGTLEEFDVPVGGLLSVRRWPG
ncbi:glycoside hydrolase family 36 protein [Actinoplanes sp. NPDC049596]|uniref:glycoside hydrolase family 36 protein n=1 Tax=unclassified Actinoplanes TaxID=2626549 RepID=UPI0034377F84